MTASLILAAVLNVGLVLMFFYAFFAELRRFLLATVGKGPAEALTWQDVGRSVRVLFGWGGGGGGSGGGGGEEGGAGKQPRRLTAGAPGTTRLPAGGAGAVNGGVELQGSVGGPRGGGADQWNGPPEERV